MRSSSHSLRGLFAAVLALAALASTASATVLFSENFNYADNTALTTTGTWSAYSPPPDVTKITVNNGSIDFTNANEGATRAFTVTPFTSGSLYYGFDLSLSAAGASANGNYFAGLATADDGSGFRQFYGKVFAKASGEGFQLGVAANNITNTVRFGSSVYDFNANYRVVVEYNLVSGALNNTASIYVNGTLIATSNWTTGTEPDLVALLVRGPVDVSNGATVNHFDNLIVATTYAEAAGASAVPEPATYAAIFGALTLGLAVWNRNRRRVVVA